MTRLFVERLLISPEEPDGPPGSFAYDETLDLNVDGARRPYVAVADFGETMTQTFVDTEKEDRDAAEAGALDTVTKVRAERADADHAHMTLGTETRAVPNEHEDFSRDVDDGTQTSIKREADDFARDEVLPPWRLG